MLCGTNAPVPEMTFPSKLRLTFPCLMYSSTPAQLHMNTSHPLNMHFVFLGVPEPWPFCVRGRFVFRASTIDFLNSFRKVPNCSVLTNPDSTEGTTVIGVCKDAFVAPGTP